MTMSDCILPSPCCSIRDGFTACTRNGNSAALCTTVSLPQASETAVGLQVATTHVGSGCFATKLRFSAGSLDSSWKLRRATSGVSSMRNEDAFEVSRELELGFKEKDLGIPRIGQRQKLAPAESPRKKDGKQSVSGLEDHSLLTMRLKGEERLEMGNRKEPLVERRGGKQMMKRSNMIAKQVISVQSALSLGFVSQLWVDTNACL